MKNVRQPATRDSKIMKTKKFAEETDGYNTENKTELSIDYYTEVESDAMHFVLEEVAETTLQSGMRFMKTLKDETEGSEKVFLDAEDCSASVIQSFTKDLAQSKYDFQFESTMQSMDHLAIIYEDESLKVEEEENSDE